ncbi:hypothetical protein J4558_00205 [Leptolyngbya sp. 15MV]|nr:hypothetical protein J4558_00205 [Leptolyngbya sp. 15MV]
MAKPAPVAKPARGMPIDPATGRTDWRAAPDGAKPIAHEPIAFGWPCMETWRRAALAAPHVRRDRRGAHDPLDARAWVAHMRKAREAAWAAVGGKPAPALAPAPALGGDDGAALLDAAIAATKAAPAPAARVPLAPRPAKRTRALAW